MPPTVESAPPRAAAALAVYPAEGHTSAPWKVGASQETSFFGWPMDVHAITCDDAVVAAVPATANARLIAAAPEMLAALRWMTQAVAAYRCLTTSPRFQQMKVIDALAELAANDCMHSEAELGPLWERARAVTAKAEGRS